MAARKPHARQEKEKTSGLPGEELNDLVYSIETKTLGHFKNKFVQHGIFHANSEFTDPLPGFDFDEISGEIKKRLRGLDERKLEETKAWLRHSLSKLNELQKEYRDRFSRTYTEMAWNILEKQEQEMTRDFEEIERYKTRISDLIAAIENILDRSKTEKAIQTSTKRQFTQLHLFDDNDADT